jgi:phosphotransferase system HPr (HPr) family protein
MARILVVEDYPDAAESTAIWLKLLGHDVEIARDGLQAVELARHQRPTFVLLDIGLPCMDGYQVASTLRQELDGPLVIIAITGYGREEDRRKALAAGCDHHFLKPVDHHALSMLFSVSNDRQHSLVDDKPTSKAMDGDGQSPRTASRQVEIANLRGFHLRAAGKFVRLAQAFQSDLAVIADGSKVSGKSILDLATLAAECGSQLELEARGPDAQAAVDALADLIARRFDEHD